MFSDYLDSPIGKLLVSYDDKVISNIDFIDNKVEFNPKGNDVINSMKRELNDYFSGKSAVFNTPLRLAGTDFQRSTWGALMKISPGEVISYKELAIRVGIPTGFRAVANANGANKIPIVIPCHRVINSNGKMGGYSCGLWRKEWLLAHEERYFQ